MATRKAPRQVMVADFETTVIAEDCRVWAWGIAPITARELADVELGQDIQSFIKRVSEAERVVYFHNLGFDGSFIIDWLLKNGYSHTTGNPRRGQFSTLISNMGKFYSINVHWLNGRAAEFRDSYKKLPMSVANIAVAFKLETTKGELDYALLRPIGWEITPDEADYIRRDVLIVTRAMALQIQEGMTKLTVGADSLNEFKRLFNRKAFDGMFPILSLELDAEMRKAYRGGFTYADTRTKGKIVGNGRVYDVNSLYPAVMYHELLPYGPPQFSASAPNPTNEYPLFITSVTLMAKLKPDHIPCIQVKGNLGFSETEYLREIDEPTTVYCTNVDLALWNEHYDLDILAFNGTWHFKAAKGLFKTFIDKWSQIKANSTGGMRALAKLMLNSLYGKFATNPDVTGKIPVLINDTVKLVKGPDETRNPVYTPMGVFITAYARSTTLRAAQAHYDRFLYADTDSLHLSGLEDVSLNVHPTELGAWKHEYDFEQGIFARAKAYTELVIKGDERQYETHIAGLPINIAEQVRFEDYQNGKAFPGKLMPKRVPGGIVLEEIEFTLAKVITNG